jgi:hypothetical protein
MKQILAYAIVLFAMVSCKPEDVQRRKADLESRELDPNSEYYSKQYEVYTLEGCEYIVVGVGKYQWGSHKGNCKNPIHQTQK